MIQAQNYKLKIAINDAKEILKIIKGNAKVRDLFEKLSVAVNAIDRNPFLKINKVEVEIKNDEYKELKNSINKHYDLRIKEGIIIIRKRKLVPKKEVVPKREAVPRIKRELKRPPMKKRKYDSRKETPNSVVVEAIENLRKTKYDQKELERINRKVIYMRTYEERLKRKIDRGTIYDAMQSIRYITKILLYLTNKHNYLTKEEAKVLAMGANKDYPFRYTIERWANNKEKYIRLKDVLGEINREYNILIGSLESGIGIDACLDSFNESLKKLEKYGIKVKEIKLKYKLIDEKKIKNSKLYAELSYEDKEIIDNIIDKMPAVLLGSFWTAFEDKYKSYCEDCRKLLRNLLSINSSAFINLLQGEDPYDIYKTVASGDDLSVPITPDPRTNIPRSPEEIYSSITGNLKIGTPFEIPSLFRDSINSQLKSIEEYLAEVKRYSHINPNPVGNGILYPYNTITGNDKIFNEVSKSKPSNLDKFNAGGNVINWNGNWNGGINLGMSGENGSTINASLNGDRSYQFGRLTAKNTVFYQSKIGNLNLGMWRDADGRITFGGEAIISTRNNGVQTYISIYRDPSRGFRIFSTGRFIANGQYVHYTFKSNTLNKDELRDFLVKMKIPINENFEIRAGGYVIATNGASKWMKSIYEKKVNNTNISTGFSYKTSKWRFDFDVGGGVSHGGEVEPEKDKTWYAFNEIEIKHKGEEYIMGIKNIVTLNPLEKTINIDEMQRMAAMGMYYAKFGPNNLKEISKYRRRVTNTTLVSWISKDKKKWGKVGIIVPIYNTEERKSGSEILKEASGNLTMVYDKRNVAQMGRKVRKVNIIKNGKESRFEKDEYYLKSTLKHKDFWGNVNIDWKKSKLEDYSEELGKVYFKFIHGRRNSWKSIKIVGMTKIIKVNSNREMFAFLGAGTDRAGIIGAMKTEENETIPGAGVWYKSNNLYIQSIFFSDRSILTEIKYPWKGLLLYSKVLSELLGEERYTAGIIGKKWSVYATLNWKKRVYLTPNYLYLSKDYNQIYNLSMRTFEIGMYYKLLKLAFEFGKIYEQGEKNYFRGSIGAENYIHLGEGMTFTMNGNMGLVRIGDRVLVNGSLGATITKNFNGILIRFNSIIGGGSPFAPNSIINYPDTPNNTWYIMFNLVGTRN